MISYDEYMNQVLKYDGDCNPVLYKDEFPNLDRKTRRIIKSYLRKGKNPDIMEIVYGNEEI